MVERVIAGVLILASITIFLIGLLKKLRVIFAGKSERNRFNRIGFRIKRVILEVLLQQKVLSNRPIAGLLHACVFFGFLLFSIETINHFSVVFGKALVKEIAGQYYRYYEILLAIIAIFVIVGIVGLAVRRFVLRKISPDPKSITSGLVALFIFLLMITYLEKFRGDFLNPKLNWWIHSLIILVFPILILHSKHLHIFFAPVNVFLRTLRIGELKVLNLDIEPAKSGDEMDLGIETIKDIPWKLRFDFFTCVECKRCRDVCPASISGQELDPSLFILQGRKVITSRKEDSSVIGNIITDKALGQCTSCFACENVCPVGVEHSQLLVGAKRGQALCSGVGSVATQFFKMIESYGNPFTAGQQVRHNLIEELEIPRYKSGETEWVLWLGCVWAYNPDFKKTVKDTVLLLKKAGINFGVLEREKCSGHHSRRQGEELQFQTLAKENIDYMLDSKVKRVLTGCPHCFHTLLREYKELNPAFNVEVVHHSIFFWQLIRDKKLSLSMNKKWDKATYHDPCYLARIEARYKEPREIIKSCGINLIELSRNCSNTFCCGGGAGGFVRESREPVRIDMMRKNEIKQSGAELLITSCPQCKMMLSGAVEKTKDIVEILAEQIL